jgi:hypothetical protein
MEMAMADRRRFELRRRSDELVYTFVRGPDRFGRRAYQRQDQDLWITHRGELGWVMWDEESDAVTGRPWDVGPRDQGDEPPEGDWVSKKGAKSYVYELVYIDG